LGYEDVNFFRDEVAF